MSAECTTPPCPKQSPGRIGPGLAAAVAAASVGLVAVIAWLGSPPPPPPASEARTGAQRLEQWGAVVHEAQISPEEDVRLIQIPDAVFPGLPSLDSHCLIYRHRRLDLVRVVCRGFSQTAGAAPER